LDWVKRRDSICFAKILVAWISSGIGFLGHEMAAQRASGSAAPNTTDRQRWGTAPAARVRLD
jgi:hypothetical protein